MYAVRVKEWRYDRVLGGGAGIWKYTMQYFLLKIHGNVFKKAAIAL